MSLLNDGREKGVRKYFKPSEKKCFCCLTFPLLAASIGFGTVFIIAIASFSKELEGFVYGSLVIGIVVNTLLLLTTLFGCLGFFNKDFTTLLLQVVIFTLLLTIYTVGSVIFTILGSELESDDGLVQLFGDIELSFEQQVFNDCCVIQFVNGGDLEVPDEDQFSFGDIVNEQLCLLLQENSDETFVGNPLDDPELCKSDFSEFQADFRGFTDKYFKLFAVLTWITVAFILFNIIFTFYQICISTRKKSDQKETQPQDFQENSPPPPPAQAQITVPPTFGFSNQQKQGMSNFMNRLSGRSSHAGPRFGEPSMAPPSPSSQGRFQGFRNSMANAFSNFRFGNAPQSANYTGVGPPLPEKKGMLSGRERPQPPSAPMRPVAPTPPPSPYLAGGDGFDMSTIDDDW